MKQQRAFHRRLLSFGYRQYKKLPRLPYVICAIPISFLLTLLFPVYRIKFIRLCSNRIGHFAMNTELLLCYLDELKKTEKRTSYYFYLISGPICNQQLLLMWKRLISIIPFAKLMHEINNIMLIFLGRKYKSFQLANFETGAGNEDIDGDFKKHPAHLFFTDGEQKKGQQLLSNMGLSSQSKYVCLLVRDETYLSTLYPDRDWSYSAYRNARIENFSAAALYLADQGYTVLRMGKAVGQHFNVDHPNVIDYANSQFRSDFADIYLTAHCDFFISTSAGLDGVAQVFRKPLLCVNVAPFGDQLQFWYPCELFITKKIYDSVSKTYLPLQHVENHIHPDEHFMKSFQPHWQLHDNTPEEILAAVIEMHALVTSEKKETAGNSFHTLLDKPIQLTMIPQREKLRTNIEKFYVRIGSDFWEKNKNMFLS